MSRGLGLCMVIVCVLAGVAEAASLSGAWDTTVSLDPQQPSFRDAIDFTSEVTVSYSLDPWTFTSISTLDSDGWSGQDFTGSGTLGAFVVASTLSFEPATPAFDQWNATVGITMAGISASADFTLQDHDVTLVLDVAGTAGDIDLSVESTFGGDDNDVCDLPWSGLVIDLEAPFCCTTVHAAATFDCDGFQDIVFSAEGLAFPSIPFMVLDAVLTFTEQTKSLTLSPRFDFGATACLDLYIQQSYTGGEGPGLVLTLDSITLEGVGLTCDVGVVTFSALSYWGGGTKPGLLEGTPYWEVYSIHSNEDGCCGPFGFNSAVYFLDPGDKLFDVSLLDVGISLQVSSQFTFSMDAKFDVEIDAFSEWAFGFLVEW